MAAARPKYFSDGDSRPLYRGKAYALLRSSGVGWLALCLYLAHALASLASARPHGVGAALFVCRCLLSAALCWNTVLSDDLHNLDIHMGRAYDAPSTLPIEQRLHAHDWRAALAVPASYHLLLVLGVIDELRIETVSVCTRCSFPHPHAPHLNPFAARLASASRESCCVRCDVATHQP